MAIAEQGSNAAAPAATNGVYCGGTFSLSAALAAPQGGNVPVVPPAAPSSSVQTKAYGAASLASPLPPTPVTLERVAAALGSSNGQGATATAALKPSLSLKAQKKGSAPSGAALTKLMRQTSGGRKKKKRFGGRKKKKFGGAVKLVADAPTARCALQTDVGAALEQQKQLQEDGDMAVAMSLQLQNN